MATLKLKTRAKKSYKGRSLEVLRYVESCGSESEVSSLMALNLVAGARLAARPLMKRPRELTSFALSL